MYRTYCDKIPQQLEDITDSFCNKPRGGLWGCRDNAWKKWCQAEQHNLRCLKKVFYWKLAEDAKLYTIQTEQDYLYLVEKYGNTRQDSIDYMLMKQDYDAVEVVGDIVYVLRYGTQSTGRRFIDLMGLNAWDVPSICVMNTDKVVRIGSNVKKGINNEAQ